MSGPHGLTSTGSDDQPRASVVPVCNRQSPVCRLCQLQTGSTLFARMICLGLFSTVIIHHVCAQNWPTNALYAIDSGTYSVCCGITGTPMRTPLPSSAQAFVRVAVDPQRNFATLTFLTDDMQTVSSIVSQCPSVPSVSLSFSNGLVFSNRLVFLADPGPPPGNVSYNYTVSNLVSSLRIDGGVRMSAAFCSDVPTQFTHSNVVAALMPTVTVRVSEVEVCWNSASNMNYQVQFRSAIGSNAWTNLGSTAAGNGSTNCVTDKVPPGGIQRLYRVVIQP